MLPYSTGDPLRSPPPPQRTAFSSSLSPSAAPFPAADAAPAAPRANPTAPSVYAAAGEWGSASWMEPPVSYMAPAAAASPPGYKGEASHRSPYGIYSGNHFSNFTGLHSLTPESSNSLSEKHPGPCRESSEAFSNGFGSSVFQQQQNAFVSKLLDHSGAEDRGPYPTRQDVNQYPFGSAYDKYMTQLSSCSTDAQPHILSPGYLGSSEIAKKTIPVMKDTIGENSFSFSSYMNPIRINLDYFDCVWNEQKDIGCQTTDKHHGNWSNSGDYVVTLGKYPDGSVVENHLGAEHLGNGRSTQESSVMKHDIGNSNSKFSPEIGFVRPREFSSELLEINNTSVDSPCWKGTPATYQPSFGIIENNDAIHSVIGAGGYNNPHQIQKAPELSAEYPGQLPEVQEAPDSENQPLKIFKLPIRGKSPADHKQVSPNVVRFHNDTASHASYFPDKQHARTQQFYDLGEDSRNLIASSQQESSCPPKVLGEHCGSHTTSISEVISTELLHPIAMIDRVHVDNLTSGSPHGNSSAAAGGKEERPEKRGEDPSQCYPGSEGTMLNISCDVSSSTRAVFLKLMHNLSVALLSNCNRGSSLPEDEEELLQSVIQNLAAVSSKKSKVEQKTDGGLGKSSPIKLANVNNARNNIWTAFHEHSTPVNTDLEFKTTVSQIFTTLPDPEAKVHDDTVDSEASVYKSLWIEAEASACKLKYELQLARMKLAKTKGHNNTLKVPDPSDDSKGSNTAISSSKPQNLGKESITCAEVSQCLGGGSRDQQSPVVNRSIVTGAHANVFDRLKVLQSRGVNISSSVEIDSEEQGEANKESYVVEDAVMARLKVLKSRPDNVASSQESNKLDVTTNRAYTVDDSVTKRLRILESRPTNVTFMDQENKQQPGPSADREDGVDDAVMARLRILKSRPDNVTSTGEVSKAHEETCMEQLDGNEVGVVASGGINDAKRFAEQCSKFLNADALADCLERKYSLGGLDLTDITGVRENDTCSSADVATPDMCKVTSDELNKGAGDSHVCTEGSQETISSPVHSLPQEWEHVLKENFFHPGN